MDENRPTLYVVGTNFTNDLADVLAAIAADRDMPLNALEANAPSPEHALAVDLSKHAIKGTLQEWWLASTQSPQAMLDAHSILGAVVRTWDGKTSAITAVDARHRRIQTRSGSVYVLTMPDVQYAANAREVLRVLGF